MLELIFKNRIPQHEKSNDRTTKEFHVKNWKKKNIAWIFFTKQVICNSSL